MYQQPFVASEALAAFLDGLRANGTPLKGTNIQLTYLIRDALDIISPETGAAQDDAELLARDFDAIAEQFDGDGAYPDDEDDEDEDEDVEADDEQ